MKYLVKIDEFEGPLDLLLHLIKEANISIYDIEINTITKQYLDYINKMEELNINVASTYIVMAAELMEIKSKSLLPQEEKEESDDEDENDVSREGLINRLVEYQKYKDLALEFRRLEEERGNIFVKAPENINNYVSSAIINDNDTSVDDLVDAFKKFLERREYEKPITTKVTNKEYSVKDRKNSIKKILLEKKRVKFDELFDNRNLDYIIVTFLSILELTKEKEIVIEQDKNFSEIDISLGGIK